MKRRGMVAAVLALAFVVAGCAAQAATPTGTPLAAYRVRAQAEPDDPYLARQVALGEMFASEGDPSRVGAALDRALSLDGSDPRTLLAAALHHDAHGRPAQAVDAYLAVLNAAPRSKDPLAAQIVELAVKALSGAEGGAVGYTPRVVQAGWKLLRADTLPAPARYELGDLLIGLAFRRGDRAEAEVIARQLGCVTRMRAAGPFGPRDLLGFDESHAALPGKPLADSYDLGFQRGVRPTRELEARGCAVNLGGGSVARGGTTYAQTYVEVAAPGGAHFVRVESPNAFELFIDGRSVLRADRRLEPLPNVRYHALELAPGRHEVVFKVSTRHPSPSASLAVFPARAGDAQAMERPFPEWTPAGFEMYVDAALAFSRGDVVAARQTLLGVSRAERVSPLLLMLRATIFLSDPLLPGDVREDEARRVLLAARKRDPELWNPALQLATMAASNGRQKEAIASLRKAWAQWPAVPAVGLTLAQMLRNEGWDHEADDVVAEVRERVPDACAPLGAELEALRSRDKEEQAEATISALMRCEAQSNARYALLLRKREWAEARRELERLASLEPRQNSYAWTLARLELAKNRGDAEEVGRQIARLRSEYPLSVTGAVEEIDRIAAEGKPEQALAALERALHDEPSSMAELQRLAPLFGGKHALSPYRRDGAEAIARYEASGRDYEGPQVLVFDYMAARVFEDGSSIELVHTIQKAQSDEAVDELAEVQVPDGAQVLTLRTIKSDGRRLEADAIEGKDTVSLPDVKPGDYVEFEYLGYNEPSEGFPGGYLGERFYFKSFEVPFDYSHMLVVLPKDLPYQVDPRGAAPEPVETIDGDLRVLDFGVEESKPLVAEPGAVSAREYLPSIRVGSGATWPMFIEGIRDVLVDRDVYDPELAALAKTIVGDAGEGEIDKRARRLYAWVLQNVENNDDAFSQAAAMLRARSGNRARVLNYMFRLGGVPSELALVRSVGADATPSKMADGDTFEHLLVSFASGGKRRFLSTVERWAPFGYVPPALSGQPALLLDAQASRVEVPESAPASEARTLVLDIHMKPDGGARVDVVETVRGSGAVSWRENLEAIPAAQLDLRFEEEYIARLLPGATLASLEIRGLEQGHKAVELAYSVDIARLGRRVSRGWALPAILETSLAPNYARIATRSTVQLVPAPLETQVTLRVHFPAGARRPEPPASVSLEAPIDGRPSFTLASAYQDGVLVVERRTSIPAMRIAPEQYAAFADFCRKVDAEEAKELVFGLP